jgi:prolyl oligopeptidase PreP (S9A serine peptidase family)
LHGVEIVDPYRWLEDQASPETRAWIEAQNRYTLGVLDGTPWRGAIRDRLNALSRYDVQGLPLARGERYFLLKRRVQDDLAILYARLGRRSPDEVLLDPHPLSPDHTTDVSLEDVSGDGRLIANRYTSASRLAIQGASNGGLLVAAALTQRPDLYRAVLCGFPDLDMVGYYRFPNNNPPALLEYGDASKPEQFPFLYAYSPYQRVTPGVRYPAVLFSTGDADTRVPPLQARKMTARLQAATTSGWPVLLRYDTKAGHAGGRPIGKIVEDESLELSFLVQQLGMEPTR